MAGMSTLRKPHHFRSLNFSSTHTYMNSPSNRITLVSEGDDDVPCLDLNFPESAGKNGNYFRRVMKFRIPIDRTTFYWNGTESQTYEIVVKVDPSHVQYLVKNEEGKFVEVSHPDHPDAEPAFVARAFLKDDTFVDEGVFILGESTRPSEMRKVLKEAQAAGATVVAVGDGGVDNLYALHAVSGIGLDPTKYFDYWYKVLTRARSREKNDLGQISLDKLVRKSSTLEFEIAPRATPASSLPPFLGIDTFAAVEEDIVDREIPPPMWYDENDPYSVNWVRPEDRDEKKGKAVDTVSSAVPQTKSGDESGEKTEPTSVSAAVGVTAKKAVMIAPAVPAFTAKQVTKGRKAKSPSPSASVPASASVSPSPSSSDKENVGPQKQKQQQQKPAPVVAAAKPAPAAAAVKSGSPPLKGILKPPSTDSDESDDSKASKKAVKWAREATAYLEKSVRRGVGRGCTAIVEQREEIRVREAPTAGRMISRSELEELERANRALSRSKRRRLRAKERRAAAAAAAASSSSAALPMPASSSPSPSPPSPSPVVLVPAAAPRPPVGPPRTWAQVAKGPVRRASPSAVAAVRRAPTASAPTPTALSPGSSSSSGAVRGGTGNVVAVGTPARPLDGGGHGSHGFQFPAVNDGPEDLGTCQGRINYMIRKIEELKAQKREEEAALAGGEEGH
ncbi:hypothetical protein Dda_1693 [Drechslerella dactyloides]|uniref:Uncharacterized protein n=1 Tax=Drechslerella dactyloides TaxID=74499 RepID=A0AAD6J2D5_DREDA|nr:hypothetical protein Dda_1693 [Drechslerella dactyloides]